MKLAIKDKSELIIFLLLLGTLEFLIINYDVKLANIFLGMIFGSGILFFLTPIRFTHNAKPNNTFQAIINASIGVGIILIATLVLSTLFQGFLGSTQEFSILSNGFSSLGIEKIIPESTQQIFAKSAFLTILTFGVVIASIETRFLGNLYESLANVFKVNLDSGTAFGIFPTDKKVIALTVIISALFVAYHFNAKGVTNNVALLITFLFAFVSLEMIRRTKEMESATYLHVFNNLLFIVPKVQQGG